jgi:large subunit ribosomal protein L21
MWPTAIFALREHSQNARKRNEKTMFAVIKTGGKQYKVAENDVIRVEKLDTEAGKKVKFKEVLMVGGSDEIKVGDPLLKGAEVTAEVLDQARDAKIIIFKKKRRQNYRRKKGHRQSKTVLRITGIKA